MGEPYASQDNMNGMLGLAGNTRGTDIPQKPAERYLERYSLGTVQPS